MKKIRLALRIAVLVAALLAACSCHKEGARRGGVVSFRFSTVAPTTRATTPGDGDASDGGGIFLTDGKPDLVILVARQDGAVVKRFDIAAPDADVVLQSATETEAVVTFDLSDEGAGDYLVFAVANDAGALTQGISSVSALEALTLTEAQIPDGRIPLSARGSFTVYEEMNGQVSLELIRCVAKVSVELVNNTGAELSLTDFRADFSRMRPDRAFVLAQDAVMPSGAVAGTLSAEVASLTVPAFDDAAETEPRRLTAGSWYVFPSTGPYTSAISFTLDGTAYSFPDLSVTDSRQKDIPSLERNQHLRVVTRISRGQVSFNFEVAEWDLKEEAVEFD